VVSCNANFANCDGVVSNGCEVNLLTNLNHCGNCGTNCAALPQHTTSSACSSGACVVTGCQANFYDLINGFADGCECAGDAIGDLCTGPQILGALNPGQAVPASGNIAPGGDADWFQITFNGNVSQSYHPKVYLTTNPGSQFLFDVYAGACGSLLPCAEGGSVQGKTQWETLYTAGDPNSVGYQPIPAVGNGGTVLIKVYRANGFPVTCDGYILTISD
jgi:hypothetical protein